MLVAVGLVIWYLYAASAGCNRARATSHRASKVSHRRPKQLSLITRAHSKGCRPRLRRTWRFIACPTRLPDRGGDGSWAHATAGLGATRARRLGPRGHVPLLPTARHGATAGSAPTWARCYRYRTS